MIIALLGGIFITLGDVCSWTPTGLSCQINRENQSAQILLGDFLALIGAVAAALYLMIGRHLRANISLTPYVFLVYSGAGIFLIAAMLLSVGPPPIYPGKVYLWMILLAVVPQLVGHSIFNWSLKYLPTGYVAVNLLGEPIGSILLAYFFLNEVPPAIKIIGAILILSGIALASFQQGSNRRPKIQEQN
jgi:drug/metabolite transporter (DMT)-like permease